MKVVLNFIHKPEYCNLKTDQWISAYNSEKKQNKTNGQSVHGNSIMCLITE